MDPLYRAQDIIRCEICDNPTPQLLCEFCNMRLCKACVGEHVLEESKEHHVVPFNIRWSTPISPKCKTHVSKECDSYCETCDISICSYCVSLNAHKGHHLVNILENFKHRKELLRDDLQELETIICPKYLEIECYLQVQRDALINNSTKLKDEVNHQGKIWHREIDCVLKKFHSEIDDMECKHNSILEKEKDNISRIISEISDKILVLKKLLISNDINLLFAYKTLNVELRRVPANVKVSLPNFDPKEIKSEEIFKKFGAFTTVSISKDHNEVLTSPLGKRLLDEPVIIAEIQDVKGAQGVTCFNEDDFWVCGQKNRLNLYSLNKGLIKSIETKTGLISDISVTNESDLLFVNSVNKSVGIVKKNGHVEKLIKLSRWKPCNICVASPNDLLVVLYGKRQQCKVVRYSNSTKKQSIQNDDTGERLYSPGALKCISENRNFDICVSDHGACAIVVVSQTGKLRFKYTGYPSFTKGAFIPVGITTDSQGRILAVDHGNDCIHIISQDGQFLRFIDNCPLHDPYDVCVDAKDRLFVTETNRNNVKKIQYCY